MLMECVWFHVSDHNGTLLELRPPSRLGGPTLPWPPPCTVSLPACRAGLYCEFSHVPKCKPAW